MFAVQCWTASQLCLQSNLQDMSVPRRLTTESVLVSRGPLYLNNDLTMGIVLASAADLALTNCYLRQGGYVIIVVCLFVCLLTTLRKNFQTDLHEIFREGWQWASEKNG